MADEQTEQTPEQEGQQAPQAGQPVPPGARQVRLNLEGVAPEYANFCTISVRQGEVFLSFGKAFAPTTELKIDNQIVMSLRNVEQLYETLSRMLEQIRSQQVQRES